MEEEQIEVTIKFKPSTFNEIMKMIRYQNLRNELKKRDKPTDLDITDFITGCVYKYIKEVNAPKRLSGLDDLGKPYRLKNRFDDLRKKRKWKQIELAKKAGIDPGNLNSILKNKNQPSTDYFLRLWVAFDCPPLNEVLYREE